MSQYYAFKVENNVVTNGVAIQSTTWASETHPTETWILGGGDSGRRYAGVGWIYLPDARSGSGDFMPPQPYPSWTKNSDNNWDPPVPYPNDGVGYVWNEATVNWVAQ